MYTALIGRRFLDHCNRADGVTRSPAEFFSEEFFPLVFGDDRYLMPAGNSKFGQLVNSRKQLEAAALRDGRAWDAAEKERLRQQALADFHSVAASTTAPEAHLVLGGYARGSEGTTSGQVTALPHAADADDVYLSWIGAAAGAGVAGGLVLLIDHPAVFDAVRDGWRLYRDVIDNTQALKANQLETWNGQWLRHRFSAGYDPSDRTLFLTHVINTKSPPFNIETVSWARLLLSLGRSIGGDAPVSAYVYSIGQVNATVGFIPLHLGVTGELRDSYETLEGFYRRLFGDAAELVHPDRLDEVYDAGMGFAQACASGAVGLRAFEPDGLRDFLPGNNRNRQPRPLDPAAAQSPLLFETWIYTMLGTQKKELLVLAVETAEMLLDFEAANLGGKTNLKKAVNDALGANSLAALIAGLTRIAESIEASKTKMESGDVARTLEMLDNLVLVTLDLSPERFQLFLALLRFKVAFLRGGQQHAASL